MKLGVLANQLHYYILICLFVFQSPNLRVTDLAFYYWDFKNKMEDGCGFTQCSRSKKILKILNHQLLSVPIKFSGMAHTLLLHEAPHLMYDIGWLFDLPPPIPLPTHKHFCRSIFWWILMLLKCYCSILTVAPHCNIYYYNEIKSLKLKLNLSSKLEPVLFQYLHLHSSLIHTFL